MIRVYLAAPFQLQTHATTLARALEQYGVGCTSRWLEAGEGNSDEWARRCLADVARCDVLLALNPSTWASSGTGGRHVELGYAEALRKPIVLVGARTNLFHYLAGVELVDVPVYALPAYVPQIVAAIERAAASWLKV